MKFFKLGLLYLSLLFAAAFCPSAYAGDWTISAVGSCTTGLGSTIESGGGLKATGGTAVVKCPLTKLAGTNALGSLYARMQRESTSGSTPFCNISSGSHYGTPNALSYGWASNTTAGQSISVALPTQYHSGYYDVYCVLNPGDTLYGIRYLQS